MAGHRRLTLMVFGAHTYLGQEVARFGRAMGHRMIACTDKESLPKPEHPWMHGVHWVTNPEPDLHIWPDGPPAALLYCDTTLFDGQHRSFQEILVQRPGRLVNKALPLRPPPRFIFRSTIPQPFLPSSFTTSSRRIEDRIADSTLPFAVLRFPLLYGPDRPDSVAARVVMSAVSRLPFISSIQAFPISMRVETAALAMLRAALEPSISGFLEPEEIARIGDVMIAQ